MENTEETTRKFKLSWYIENYYSLYVGNEESPSPSILAENLDNSEWYIRLIPERDKEQILCYLYQVSKIGDERIFFFDYECNFTNVNGEILKSLKGMHCLYEKGYCLTLDLDQFSEKFRNLSICFVLKSGPLKKVATGCEIKTKINIKRCAFKWNVRNNSSAWSQEKKPFYLDSSRFEIELTKSKDLYTIAVCKRDEMFSKNVEGKISLLNMKGDVLCTKTAVHSFKDGVWKFPNFISIPSWKTQGATILPNEMFVMSCEFAFFENLEVEPEERVSYTYDSQTASLEKEESFTLLEEDVQYLTSVKKGWDVRLQVEDKHLPAHKHVLASQSPVFSAMFEHDMLENQRGVVIIPNTDVVTVKLFLNFIYLERVEFMNYDSSMKLLIIAHEYQALGLIEKCLKYVIPSLSADNVCEALVIADMSDLEQLKESALSYVIENCMHVVIEPEWSNWLEKNKKFAADLIKKLDEKLKTVYFTNENDLLVKQLKDSQEALYKFVSSLLKCGANYEIEFEFGYIDYTFLEIFAGLGLDKVTFLLLQSGARPTYNDLVKCFKNGDLSIIEAFLKHGAPVKSGPTLCESALHCLPQMNSKEKVMSLCRLLIKYDADVDFENECYNTPLFYITPGDAEPIEALLFYGAKPCYKCPRGTPLEHSFDMETKVVQSQVKYAALYVNQQLSTEMYNFFQYFKKEGTPSGKKYLKFAQECMAEINVLKSLKVDGGKNLFDLAVSQGATLKSFHEDPSTIRKANEHLNKSKLPIYREVLQKKLNKSNLV